MKENDFLDWIYARGGFDPARVLIGPGDDMGMVAFDRDKLLVAVDQVLDGVHFDLASCGPEAAGRKAMARNLSDIAAMAVLPVGAVASVALPENLGQAEAREIYLGLRKLGDEFSCPLVGGDVSVWPGKLAISVTVFAKPAGATGGIAPVPRTGARAGQAICVTGSLGGAWASERHLNFTPRVREAIVLALRYKIKSMIDISDGLAMDLSRLCKASGVGAEILARDIPIADDALAGRADITPLQAALGDGEDYELLFTLPAGQARRVCNDDHMPIKITRIGTITKDQSLTLVSAAGQVDPLPTTGWQHGTI